MGHYDPLQDEEGRLSLQEIWQMQTHNIHKVGGGGPDGQRKILCLNFSFLALKCDCYFIRGLKKRQKALLSEMTVKSVPFEGRARMKTRRKESDFEGGVI